jgi:hypothetical protein
VIPPEADPAECVRAALAPMPNPTDASATHLAQLAAIGSGLQRHLGAHRRRGGTCARGAEGARRAPRPSAAGTSHRATVASRRRCSSKTYTYAAIGHVGSTPTGSPVIDRKGATMPVTTKTPDLRDRLKETQAAVSSARNEHAATRQGFEKARTAVAKLNVAPAKMTATPEWRACEAAKADHDEAFEKLEQTRAAEHGLLQLLGEAQRSGGGDPRLGNAIDEKTPGGWLSAVIRRQGGGAMALAQPITTDGLGSVEALDRVFFKRLEQRSALLASGIQVIDIETTSIDVGEVTGDMTPAVPTAETDPITKSDVPLEDREITPPKFPVLVTMSVEAHNDARPIRMAAVETKMLQAIGLGFDAAAFHGASGSLHPGLQHTTGISIVARDSEDAAYDWAADAIGSLLAVSGQPVRLFISPFTVRSLLKLKTTTNEYQLADPQSAASALMGVPVTITRGVADGEAFMADLSTLAIVRRQEVQTEVFPGYDVDHALVGVRSMMRAQLVVVDPRGTVRITGLPTPEP